MFLITFHKRTSGESGVRFLFGQSCETISIVRNSYCPYSRPVLLGGLYMLKLKIKLMVTRRFVTEVSSWIVFPGVDCGDLLFLTVGWSSQNGFCICF